MSRKELDRVGLLSQVQDAVLSQQRAAQVLGLSVRQVRRLVRRYKQEGAAGLAHRARGKASNRRIAEAVRAEVVAWMQDEDFHDYGPTLLSETLLEERGIPVSRETLRQWMIAEGQWEATPAKARPRAWRERRACWGEMLQMDTSIHAWFEGRGEEAVLIAVIDDATSHLLGRFFQTDSTATNMALLRDYIARHGRPGALYVDKASHFMTTREPTVDEDLAGQRAQTQIQRALEELGIEHITAHSPQAKGRIERCFQTLQDRLVKGLRRAGVSTIAEANRYLEEVFLPRWQDRFTVDPREPADAHRPVQGVDLDAVFSRQETRTVTDDYTFSYHATRYQVLAQSVAPGLRRDTVTVEARLDGTLRVRWRDRYLQVTRLPEHAAPRTAPRSQPAAEKAPASRPPATPGPEHPWRRSAGRAAGSGAVLPKKVKRT